MFHWFRLTLITCTLLSAKAFACAHTPFIVYSCPKCGTHLIMKTLQLLLDEEPHKRLGWDLIGRYWLVQQAEEEGRFAVAHNWPGPLLHRLTKQGYKVLLHVRDPRDQLISIRHWPDWTHEAREIEEWEEQLNELITGELYGWAPPQTILGSAYETVSKLPEETWHMTRFEDLVGSQGGGDDKIQVQTVLDLAAFLEIDIDRERAEEVAGLLFGPEGCWTFRKGQIGKWKENFLPYQAELFEEHHGALLEQLGYDGA